MSDRKNVLFIVIDQLRADCVFGVLAEHVDLPNIRSFARDAVRFDNHFSVTTPCGPSRASILTGQYTMNHRSVRNGTPLRHDTPNIATEMRKAGYLPMLFGYTDTSQDPRAFAPDDPALTSYEQPLAAFEEILAMRQETPGPWHAHLKARGYDFHDGADLYCAVAPDGGAPRLNDPALYAAADSDTAFLTDGFLDHIKDGGDKPWFAHLTYIRPHPPLVAPAPYNTMYDPDALPLPARLPSRAQDAALHPFLASAQHSVTLADTVEGFPGLEDTDANTQALRAIYLGLATEVDHHIGRVLNHLRESGQYDETLVVLTADHGEMLGDHYSWGKKTAFDAAYRTPLIIRVPGNAAQAGACVTHPTESIDVTPTILDWIGQDAPNAMDGRSLLPILTGNTPDDWRGYTFSEFDYSDPLVPTNVQRALGTGPSTSNLCILRDGRFTLIEFAADLDPILFDHDGAGEFENVVDNPALQTDLVRLTRTMLRHRMGNMDHTLSLDAITPDGPRRARRHS